MIAILLDMIMIEINSISILLISEYLIGEKRYRILMIQSRHGNS